MSATKDYSFASGGLFWKMVDRTKFEAKSLRNQLFFVFGMILLCWVPLVVLCLSRFGWDQFYLLFLRDIATQVRFLFVMPVLLFTRRSVNKSFNSTIHFFHETKIVDSTNDQAFENVLTGIEKWRNSKIVDFLIIGLVYSAFYLQGLNQIHHTNTYAPWHLVNDHITAAGWWYMIFSLPVLQILLYRWIYTIILWFIFLWKISKLDLHLSALHPDGMGGLGFLKYMQLSFFPVALAFSALMAGVTNNVVIFSGASLSDYKIAIGSILLFVLLLFIFPLLLLVPLLSKVKRKYFLLYSLEAWPFARIYEKQLEAFSESEEEKPDASWHVDMLGSFEKTREMKVFLVDKSLLLAFAAAVILPFLPVIAQQIPLKDLFLSLAKKILG